MKLILINRNWVACLIVFLSFNSYSAEWRPIHKAANVEIYIDQSTLPAGGGEKTITLKSNAIQGEKSPSSIEFKYLINCSEKTFALIGAKQFNALDLQGEGVVLKTSNPPAVTNPRPGSVGELYIKAACEPLKPPVASAPVVPPPSRAPIPSGPQKPTDIIIINKDNAAMVGSCHGALSMAHNSGYSWVDLGAMMEKTNRLGSMYSGNLTYSEGLQNGLNQMRDASPQLQAQTVQYCVKLLRL